MTKIIQMCDDSDMRIVLHAFIEEIEYCYLKSNSAHKINHENIREKTFQDMVASIFFSKLMPGIRDDFIINMNNILHLTYLQRRLKPRVMCPYWLIERT